MAKHEWKWVAIDQVIPYENNPRKNDDAVEKVKNSIKEFGFRGAIWVDKENVVIAGHTRLRAAQELGLKEVPIEVIDDLDEQRIKALRLADNKTAELSGWDFEKLDLELSEIDLDMGEFGFEMGNEMDIDSLFTDAPVTEKEPKKIQCPHCGEWFEI